MRLKALKRKKEKTSSAFTLNIITGMFIVITETTMITARKEATVTGITTGKTNYSASTYSLFFKRLFNVVDLLTDAALEFDIELYIYE